MGHESGWRGIKVPLSGHILSIKLMTVVVTDSNKCFLGFVLFGI